MYCELCDKNAKVKWKCVECEQGMCDQCKNSHQRISATRNHRISDVLRTKSLSNEEVKVVRCKFHPKENVQKYCIVCFKSVCQSCIDEHHATHQTVRISNIYLNEKRKGLADYIQEAEHKLVTLSFSAESVLKNMKLSDRQKEHDIAAIKNKEDCLIDIVRSVSEDCMEQINTSHEQDQRMLKTRQQTIQTTMKDLEERIQVWKDKMKLKPDVSIIKFVSDAGEKLHDLETKVSVDVSFMPSSKFFPKETLPNNIQKSFGEINIYNKSIDEMHDKFPDVAEDTVEISDTSVDFENTATVLSGTSDDGFMVSSFKPGKSASLIACTNDGQSWIANSFYYGSKSVSLITSSGEILRNINVGYQIYDIVLTGTGELLVTASGGSDIMRLTGNSNFTSIANVSPLQTNGICAVDKDIMVCLHDEGRGKVVRLSMAGKIKQTIEYDDENRLIFTMPTLVRENADGNICIVDNGKLLVVTDNYGRIRFTYNGYGRATNVPRKELRCLGLACDRMGNILLSDDWNHQVHMLDKQGNFVKLLPLNEHGINNPLGMSIDSTGNLWLCNTGGESVAILDYLI